MWSNQRTVQPQLNNIYELMYLVKAVGAQMYASLTYTRYTSTPQS